MSNNVPDIKPIKVKQFASKQSKYDVVGQVPIRSIILSPSGSGKGILLQNMILDIYINTFLIKLFLFVLYIFFIFIYFFYFTWNGSKILFPGFWNSRNILFLYFGGRGWILGIL